MKHFGKQLLAGVLTAVMLVSVLPPTALAALVDNTPDQNEAILRELTAFWGDEKTAQEAMELLRRYNLIDEDGNVLTDWSGTITVEEDPRSLTVLDAMSLTGGTVTVHGRACDGARLSAVLRQMEALGLLAEGRIAADWQVEVIDDAETPGELETPPAVKALGREVDAAALQEVTDFLKEYGLLTETGCLADWGLTQPGKSRPSNVTELLSMLEDPAADRSMVVTVDGTAITLGDFEVMMQIEAEIKRIRDTYLQENVELTPEQASNLYQLYEQLSENGIMLYNTQGADALTFPSGLDHNARVSVSTGTVPNTGGSTTLNWSVTGDSSVTFDLRILDGSAKAAFSGGGKTASGSGQSGSQTITVAALDPKWTGSDYWKGDRVVLVQAYNLKGALFSNGKDSITIPIKVTNHVNISASDLPVNWSVTNGSKNQSLSESLRYLMRSGIISTATWSISTSGYKKDTCFAKGAENESIVSWEKMSSGLNNVRPFTPFYYQYLQAAGYANGRIVLGKEVGYAADVRTTLGIDKLWSPAAKCYQAEEKDSNCRSAQYYNKSDADKANAVPRVNNSSGNDSVQNASGDIDLRALGEMSSIDLKASGKWATVGSGYYKSYSSGSPIKTWGMRYAYGTASATLTVKMDDTKAPAVTSVVFPNPGETGTFPSGSEVPITVTFSEPVRAQNATITANGVTCTPYEGSNTLSNTLTFRYVVKTVDTRGITVTAVNGVQDIKGNALSSAARSDRSNAALLDQTPRLEDALAGQTITSVADQVKYTAPSADQPEKTAAPVTVTISLPQDQSLRNLITSVDQNGASTVLEGVIQLDGELCTVPLMVNSDNMTAEFEIDAAVLLNQQHFVLELREKGTNDQWLFDRYAAFSVNPPVPLLADSLSIQTPDGWPEGPIYASNPPAAAALTLQAVVSAPAGTTWTQTRWVSSNEKIATIDASGRVYPLSAGTVSFYLEAVNGNLTEYGEQRSQPVSLTIQQGAEPYLRIPENGITIRSGDPVTVRWASNLVQKNIEYGGGATTFTITVTGPDGQQVGEPYVVTYDPADQSDPALWMDGSPNQSYTINGLADTDARGYTVTVSASAGDAVPGSQKDFTAQATVTVVSQPVSVRLTRPGSLFQTNTGVLTVHYTLNNYDSQNNAKFKLVVTDNATGQPVPVIEAPHSDTGGSFTIDLAGTSIPDGFRTIYDVSLQAKNTAEKDWSRDSFTLYIYDKDCLDILVQPVTKDGITTVDVDGDRVTMSNEEWIASLTQDQILALNRDIDLQAAISINYGDHAWGEASDRIQWASENSRIAAVNYPQGAYYENIETLPYTSFAPATQFLLSGKNDGKTVAEAIHALAGDALSSSVEITVETLKDKLYLFQFYPVGKATLTYTNGDGVSKTHDTDANGRAAIYEASGIASDVYVEADIGGEKYLGTVYQEDLVSQEKDAVSLELYPLNSLNLRKAATLPVYLKKPDGTNYDGAVTVRAGVYRNGVYCAAAKYSTTAGAATIDGGTEQTAAFTDGKATFYYDLTQFNTNSGANPVTAADDIQFVLELGADGYYPVLFTATGTTNEDDAIRLSERIVNLEAVPEGQSEQPFVAKQAVYFSGEEKGVSTDVRNKNGKVGPSADYPDVLLSTTVLWWGSENDQSDRGIRYVDSTGQILTEQELAENYYPFCSMPVSHSTVPLDRAQMEAIGLGGNGVRALSLQYLENGTAVKKETMRWQLININAESAIGSRDLRDRLSALSAIIGDTKSGGVTTVKNDFLALGISLATASSIDTPFLKLQLAPTADPTVFKGLVYIGLNNFEGDNVSGVAADSSRGSDVDYFPGLEQIKGLYKQKAGYGATAGTQVGYAAKLLASNVRQGGGTSKTGDKKISYALQGYFETEVYFDFAANEWKMVVLTGGFTAGGGMGYEWTWNTQVGPVPFFLQLEAGAAGAIEFQAALDHVKNGNDYLTELRLYAYLQAFGGIGFDYAVIALKLGLYGRVGLDATLRWLNAIDADSAQFGAALNVDGEIGAKFQVEVLFVSYEKILWSQPIGKYSGKFDDWTEIDEYWKQVKDGNSGNGDILNPGSRRLAANFVAANYDGDTGIYAADQEAALLDRSYLSEYQRSYNSAGPSLGGGMSLFSFFSSRNSSNIVETLENSYSLAAPVLSDDGGYLFYLDDGNDATDATNVRVAVMERNSSGGYNRGSRLSDDGYGDSGLKAAGTGENAVAVWSRVTEKPAVTEPGQSVTPDVQAGMLNSSDIMVAVCGGSGWTVKNLTENNGVADLAPVVAANGSRILVAWRQVASSSATDLTNFDTRDYIYYSISENGGSTWTDPQPIYNGTSGAVKGLEAAMLDSGEAAVAFTLQTGAHDTSTGEYYQEIAYAIVDKISDGYDVVRYAQMTDDTNLDENPQVAAVKLDGDGIFVLGWHCMDSESGESDIRLAAVDGDGNWRTGFVDALSSLIQNADVGISADFQFSKNAATLDQLSILWSDTAAEDEATQNPTHDYLSAIRFRTENDQGSTRISVTAAQQIAEMGDYTAIDSFNAYVGEGGALHAAIQGTYYNYESLQSYPVIYSDGTTGAVQVAGEMTSIFTALGAYADTLRVDSVIPDYANIRKGTSLPVQISVTNLGTQPMTQVAVTIDSQTTTFGEGAGSAFVSIAPGETRSLTVFYTVPSAGTIPNPSYTITGTFEGGSTDKSETETLILNIPDLGIANPDGGVLVDAVDGKRILQFSLYNLSDAELAGSGRTVQFNLYTDAACTSPIDPQYLTLVQSGGTRSGDALLTVGGDDLAAIDEGSYTLQYRFDLASYISQVGSEFADEGGEVRDGGVTVYAKAWVELPGEDGGEMLEYNSSNNVTSINFESLLKQAEGAPTAVTHTLDNSGEGSKVTVTLQNNSMTQKTTGNVIFILLDADGTVLEQKQSYTGGQDNGLITLDVEERKTLSEVTFSQKGADVQVLYTDAKLADDANTNIASLSLHGVPLSYDKAAKTWRNTVTFAAPGSALLSIVPEDPRAAVTVSVNGAARDVPVQLPLTEGETTMTITVTAADGTTTETYSLKLSKPVSVAGVALNKTSLSLTAGDTEQLTAVITPADAANQDISWSSSNPSATAVDASGTVTAVSVGTAVITVTTADGGKTAACTVTVSARPAEPDEPDEPEDPAGPEEPVNPGGAGGDPGISASTHSVTIEKPEHGKVTASPSNAASGSTVTLTVKPDSGYVLDTLTITDSRGNEIKLTAQDGGKYTFVMPNRTVTVKAAFAPLPGDTEKPCDGGVDCPSRAFTDLGGVGTWYHEAVDYALRNNLMGGYGNGLFGPNNNLTRAQLAQILYNREGRPAVTGSSPFADVANGAWYSDAITWAAEYGIVGGYGNGRFGPNDNITREQLAAILWRYSKSPAATNKELHFNDVDEISGYSLDAIRWAVEHGILNGFGDGRLGPKGLATRAQVAQMLKNFIENQEENS